MQLNDNCVDPVCTVGTSPHTTRTRSHDREGEAPGRRLAALNMDICGREKSETPSTHPGSTPIHLSYNIGRYQGAFFSGQLYNSCSVFKYSSMLSVCVRFHGVFDDTFYRPALCPSAQLSPAQPSSAQRAEDRFTVLHILWVLSLVTRPHSNGQKTFNGAEINLMLTKNAINC